MRQIIGMIAKMQTVRFRLMQRKTDLLLMSLIPPAMPLAIPVATPEKSSIPLIKR